MGSMQLEIERNFFNDNINEWRISHLGEYVLIKDSNLIGFFQNIDDAFKHGAKLYGLSDFFIEQILPNESVNISFYGRAT